uniref:Sulfite exporter TauE/SafE family protein 3-like n=1 Tax=Cicer arietinum TaxID=3827 RepID=A0A3Q7WXI4_CICAR|nr:sulfite exporter TauE/SafE family protein 3-like [Cicer arietinum]
MRTKLFPFLLAKPFPSDCRLSAHTTYQITVAGQSSLVATQSSLAATSESHTQNYTTGSVAYWILNLLQVPIIVGMSSYEAVLLYKGKRVIASKEDQQTQWSVQQLIIYCACGIVAGIIGGLLGLGGGFILGPLFIGLEIPPQVP